MRIHNVVFVHRARDPWLNYCDWGLGRVRLCSSSSKGAHFALKNPKTAKGDVRHPPSYKVIPLGGVARHTYLWVTSTPPRRSSTRFPGVSLTVDITHFYHVTMFTMFTMRYWPYNPSKILSRSISVPNFVTIWFSPESICTQTARLTTSHCTPSRWRLVAYMKKRHVHHLISTKLYQEQNFIVKLDLYGPCEPSWKMAKPFGWHLLLKEIGLSCAPWCTTQISGAQCRSVVDNVALYHWSGAQCMSCKPTQTHTQMYCWQLLVRVYIHGVHVGTKKGCGQSP